ncbi:MAG: Omp28-related outer membrane protein [Saprospiraceae bacterium]
MKKLFTLFLAISMVGAISAQTYLSENFEAGIPAGWTAENQWKHGNASNLSSQYFTFPAHTSFMAVNDDALGSSGNGTGRLISADIDLSTATAPLLTFDAYFINGDYQGTDEKARLFVSKDGGATWTLELDLGGAGSWQSAGILLSDYAGETIKLAFDYADGNGWNYGYGVDDVRIEEAPALDVKLSSLNIRNAALTGMTATVAGTIKNNGTTPISSVKISWSDGTNEYEDVLNGLNIPTLGTYDFVHSSQATTAQGDNVITVTLSEPNAGADENPDDNSLEHTLVGYTPAPGKKVVVEEGTGTWCGWCPRGTIFMDYMADEYEGFFIPIAVHNGDPMTNATYDDLLGISAFPNMVIMREETFGFGTVQDIEDRFFPRIAEAPAALVQSAGTFDPVTRDLSITAEAHFQTSVSGDYRLAVVLVEDGVTGTGSGYNQVNYYSGGANGPMGGYENLPDPVPASQMVYDHVGRTLVGGFYGAAGSVPASVSADEFVAFSFDAVNIPAAYNIENLIAVTMLLGPDDEIVNANSQSWEELLNAVLDAEEVISQQSVDIFPNPVSDFASVKINLEAASQVTVRVINMAGAEVAFRDYGVQSGELVFPIDVRNLPSGLYQVQLTMNDGQITKKVVVQH